METREGLALLEHTLQKVGAPIANYLAPGLPGDEVRLRLGDAGVPAGADLVALFEWHDGVDVDRARGLHKDAEFIVPAVSLRSLGESLTDRARAIEMAEDLAGQLNARPESFWRPEWVPVLRAHHAEVFALSGRTNEVWGVDFVDEPVLLYPTLADLLERVIWRYESGIYSVGSDRRLMADRDRRRQLEGPARGTI